jgi:hypothetical protein
MDEEMNTGGSPAPDTAPAPEAPATDTGTPDVGGQAAEQAEQPAEESHAPEVAIKVDPQTGKRRVVFPAQEQAETQPPAEEQAQEQTPQAPQQYSANDIVQLVATGQQIDQARVPQELQGYAAAIQQQRINAAQMAQMQQMQMQRNAQPPIQAPPKPTEEQIKQAQTQRAAAYQQITRLAEQKASQDVGITKEELDDAEYSDDEELQKKVQAYKAAVRFNTDAISNEIMRQRAIQAQQAQAIWNETQETMKVIMPKWQEYQKDPHYNDIDNMMADYYKHLPFDEGVKVKQSLDRFVAGRPVRADADVLDNYYKKTKEAYYSQATGVSTTPQPAPQKQRPPRVEQPGQHGTSAPQAVDWGKMRSMTPRQRSEFLRTYLR